MLIINFIKQVYNLLQNQSQLIEVGLFSKSKLNFRLNFESNEIKDKYYLNRSGIICKSSELNSVIKYKFNFVERLYIRFILKKINRLLSEIDKNNLTTHLRNLQPIIK